jgi:hypothetical protein
MIMRDRALFDSDFMQSVGKTLAVTCFSALTGFLCVKILPLGLINHSFVIIVKLSVISLFVLSVHLIVSFAFGLNEAKTVVDRLKRVILRPVRL